MNAEVNLKFSPLIYRTAHPSGVYCSDLRSSSCNSFCNVNSVSNTIVYLTYCQMCHGYKAIKIQT